MKDALPVALSLEQETKLAVYAGEAQHTIARAIQRLEVLARNEGIPEGTIRDQIGALNRQS